MVNDVRARLTAGYVIQSLHISYHDNDYIHVTRKGGIHDNGLIYYTGQSKYCPFDSLTNCTLWHWLNDNDELAEAVCVIIIYRQARLLRHESKKSAPVSCMQYVYDVLSAGIDGPLSIYCTSPLSADFPVTVYESADNLAIHVYDYTRKQDYVTVTRDIEVAEYIIRNPYNAWANDNGNLSALDVKKYRKVLSLDPEPQSENGHYVYRSDRAALSTMGPLAHKLFSVNVL